MASELLYVVFQTTNVPNNGLRKGIGRDDTSVSKSGWLPSVGRSSKDLTCECVIGRSLRKKKNNSTNTLCIRLAKQQKQQRETLWSVSHADKIFLVELVPFQRLQQSCLCLCRFFAKYPSLERVIVPPVEVHVVKRTKTSQCPRSVRSSSKSKCIESACRGLTCRTGS